MASRTWREATLGEVLTEFFPDSGPLKQTSYRPEGSVNEVLPKNGPSKAAVFKFRSISRRDRLEQACPVFLIMPLDGLGLIDFVTTHIGPLCESDTSVVEVVAWAIITLRHFQRRVIFTPLPPCLACLDSGLL